MPLLPPDARVPLVYTFVPFKLPDAFTNFLTVTVPEIVNFAILVTVTLSMVTLTFVVTSPELLFQVIPLGNSAVAGVSLNAAAAPSGKLTPLGDFTTPNDDIVTELLSVTSPIGFMLLRLSLKV